MTKKPLTDGIFETGAYGVPCPWQLVLTWMKVSKQLKGGVENQNKKKLLYDKKLLLQNSKSIHLLFGNTIQ